MSPRVVLRARAAGGVAGVLIVWQAATLLARSPLAPTPLKILSTIIGQFSVLAGAVPSTAIEATVGFAIGAAGALALATMFIRSARAQGILYNVAVTMHSIPFIAIIPILVIWFGNGYAPKIALAALACFFPILVNATRGFRSVSEEMMEMMVVLGASWWETFRRIRVPMSLPYVFAAFKVGAPAAVLGAIIAEWIGSQTGVGYQILNAMFNFNPPMLWATMVVSTLLASIGFAIFAVLERVMIGNWSGSAGAGVR